MTTQMLSLQGVKAEAVAALPTDERLLSVEVLGRHRNRLRKGHHAGNQFRLVVRDVREGTEELVRPSIRGAGAPRCAQLFRPATTGTVGDELSAGCRIAAGCGPPQQDAAPSASGS